LVALGQGYQALDQLFQKKTEHLTTSHEGERFGFLRPKLTCQAFGGC
jgi:hypothetical protein